MQESNEKLQLFYLLLEFENGISTKELAQKYGYTIREINVKLNEGYRTLERKKPNIKSKVVISLKEVTDVINEYKNGESISELFRKYSLSKYYIEKCINMYYKLTGEDRSKIEKKTINNRNSKKQVTLEDATEVIDFYSQLDKKEKAKEILMSFLKSKKASKEQVIKLAELYDLDIGEELNSHTNNGEEHED